MQVIQGRHFILAFMKNGQPVPVCYATDFTIQMQRDVKERSGPQGKDRDYIPAYKGYTITVSGVVSYIDGYSFIDLEDAFNSGVRLDWRGRDKDNGGVVHGGTVILTNLAWASPVRGDFSFESSAIGCGPKTRELLPTVSTVYLADENRIRLVGCPNPYPVSLFWYNGNTDTIGAFIGIALNADDVISQYNNYLGNDYYTITIGITGCDFNLLSEWNAPFIPTVIFAEAAPSLGLWTGEDDEGISNDQVNDNLISPGYA